MEINSGGVGLFYRLPNTLFCTVYCFFCKIAHLPYVAMGESSEIFMKCKCAVLFLHKRWCNGWTMSRMQMFPLCWCVIVTVQMIEMPSPYFCFISFPHLLGKTEEECSFHTLKALFPSRKWATEDTPIMLPSSNAGDMGALSVWYATGRILMTFRLCCSAFSVNVRNLCLTKSLLLGDGNPSQCIRQEVRYLQLFLWVLYMIMSPSPAISLLL